MELRGCFSVHLIISRFKDRWVLISIESLLCFEPSYSSRTALCYGGSTEITSLWNLRTFAIEEVTAPPESPACLTGPTPDRDTLTISCTFSGAVITGIFPVRISYALPARREPSAVLPRGPYQL